MALEDILKNSGTLYKSPVLPFSGKPTVNPLTTKDSILHAGLDKNGNATPGYSITGADQATVTKLYGDYIDGDPYTVPPPSNLDISGVDPNTPLKDPNVNLKNGSTFSNGTYKKSIDPTLVGRI